MANIQTLSAPSYGKVVIDRLNEIIDWLNGVTDTNRVVDITVSGQTLTVTYINGNKNTFTLPNTTYQIATTSQNGLATAGNIATINALTQQISALNNACHAIEVANEAIDSIPDPSDDDGGGGGDGDGPDSGGGDGDSGGDDGGHGGGGGDF